MTPVLSVVIPCFNEEEVMQSLRERITAAAAPWRAQDVEIILVDDGSHDGTWEEIRRFAAEDSAATGIRLSRNFGHQMAVACGLARARGQRVLLIDADLQDPPELLPALMAKMNEGFDVVYGRRTQRRGESVFKKTSAWLFYRILGALSDVTIPRDTGDFRLMSRKAVDALAALPERVRFTRGLVSWLGFKQTALDYERAARHAGRSHYPLAAMLRFAAEGLTSFSTRPLQLAIWLGLIMMAISVVLLGYVFMSWLMFSTVRGWTSLAAIFLLFQSMQWLMLGIIGSYLAVIFRESKGRPLYIIDETTEAP